MALMSPAPAPASAADARRVSPPLPRRDVAWLDTATWLRVGAIALVALLATVLVALDWHSPIRAAVAFLFLMFCPGLAVSELLQVRDRVQQVAMAAGISLAIDAIVAIILLYLQILTAGLGVPIVAAITCVLLLAAVVRARRAELADARSDAGIT